MGKGLIKEIACTKCGKKVQKIYSKGLCSHCAVQAKIGTAGVKKRRRYSLASHGSRKTIQKAFGVSGDTHQSEHTIGYAVLSAAKRGGSTDAKFIENNGLAYQEKYEYHREHIGTGTKSTPDTSGLNASGYRNAQRNALEEGSVSNAIQLNQLCYAFLDGFQTDHSEDMEKADGSFKFMLGNAQRVTYAKADGSFVHVGVDQVSRCESYLSRLVARTGKFPTDAEIGDAKRMFGIPTKL